MAWGWVLSKVPDPMLVVHPGPDRRPVLWVSDQSIDTPLGHSILGYLGKLSYDGGMVGHGLGVGPLQGSRPYACSPPGT
jgi:hypothetical protein